MLEYTSLHLQLESLVSIGKTEDDHQGGDLRQMNDQKNVTSIAFMISAPVMKDF